jgi:hypothetical protein
MDADAELWKQLGSDASKSLYDSSEEVIIDLINRFAIWPSVDTYVKAPWLARFALRRQRHRTDERAPGEKRDLWGMPDELGYFADDNSLLKSTYKNVAIAGKDNPYGKSKITTGLVCCHIWPGTTGNPLLFSFLPNLVWLPKSLSRFTDVFQDKPIHKAHFTLQELSYRRYANLKVNTGIEDSKNAWNHLNRPSVDFAQEVMFNELQSEPSLSNRILIRHTRLLSFLDAALSDPPTVHRRFSKRYHLGFGSGIDSTIPPINLMVPRQQLENLRIIIQKSCPRVESQER